MTATSLVSKDFPSLYREQSSTINKIKYRLKTTGDYMPNSGDISTSNDNGTDSEDSSDDDEENMSVHPTELQAGLPADDGSRGLPDRIQASELDYDAPSRNSMVPIRFCGVPIGYYWYLLMFLLMGFSISFYWYWVIAVLIGWAVHDISLVLTSHGSYDKQLNVSLGNTQPCLMNFSGYRDANEINQETACPSDTLLLLIESYTFSTTITECGPLPQESEGVEETQPATMPVPFIANTRAVTNDENTHSHMYATPQMNHDEITPPALHNHTFVDSGERRMPTEIPSMDFSTASTDQRTDEDHGDDHGRLSIDTITSSMHGEDSSSSGDVDEGETSMPTTISICNVRNNAPSNETNLNGDQTPAPTTENRMIPSAETSDLERNANVSLDKSQQANLRDTHLTVIGTPKLQRQLDSSDESSEETAV